MSFTKFRHTDNLNRIKQMQILSFKIQLKQFSHVIISCAIRWKLLKQYCFNDNAVVQHLGPPISNRSISHFEFDVIYYHFKKNPNSFNEMNDKTKLFTIKANLIS